MVRTWTAATRCGASGSRISPGYRRAPAATRVLADHGAEVIKIESDFAWAPAGGASANTPTGVGYRHNWNAGKLSITLYMNTVEGLDIARRLVAVSDVVAENFSGRVMGKWGLDYHGLRQIRPDIIMLSMSGPGRTGPWKDYVTFGQTLQSWSGLTYLTGFPDSDPTGPASALQRLHRRQHRRPRGPAGPHSSCPYRRGAMDRHGPARGQLRPNGDIGPGPERQHAGRHHTAHGQPAAPRRRRSPWGLQMQGSRPLGGHRGVHQR